MPSQDAWIQAGRAIICSPSRQIPSQLLAWSPHVTWVCSPWVLFKDFCSRIAPVKLFSPSLFFSPPVQKEGKGLVTFKIIKKLKANTYRIARRLENMSWVANRKKKKSRSVNIGHKSQIHFYFLLWSLRTLLNNMSLLDIASIHLSSRSKPLERYSPTISSVLPTPNFISADNLCNVRVIGYLWIFEEDTGRWKKQERTSNRFNTNSQLTQNSETARGWVLYQHDLLAQHFLLA